MASRCALLNSFSKSFSSYTARMPLPPPPRAAFIITGYPIEAAISFPLAASITGSLVPGMTGTPAASIVFLASCLLPVFSITSADGPINVILHLSQSSANLLFSDKNPNPG